ncbi:unnamed protein product [Discosporangium mesarthrocarpum]
MSFNTAISALMVFSNHLSALESPPAEALEALVLMVSPFAPHLAEECWRLLGKGSTGLELAYEPWVEWDEALCESSTVTMGVQVNGKVRAELELPKDATEAEARSLAGTLPGVRQSA